MPLIIGYNISPLSEDQTTQVISPEGDHVIPEPTDRAYRYHWRYPLGALVEKVTQEFWGLNEGAVSCVFPHDPSVSTRPYPVATLIVDLLYERPDRPVETRQAFARILEKKVREFLNDMRDTKDARVEVAIRPFNPEACGFFLTPT